MSYDPPFTPGGEWDLDALYADRVVVADLSDRPATADAPDDALFLARDQGNEGVLYRNDADSGWVVVVDPSNPDTEAVEDIVGALVQAASGSNVSVTYDDAGDALTIDTTALNEEEVEDAVSALLTAGNAITLTYDDANDVLTVAVDESGLSFYDGTNLTADVDNSSVSTEEATIDGKRVYIQSSEPSSPETDDVWIDIS